MASARILSLPEGLLPSRLAERSARNFDTLLAPYDRQTLDADPSVILGVWSDFTIAYVNPAYLANADQNGAQPDFAEKYGVGSSLLSALPGPVKLFYVRHLNQALATGERWHHDYSCDTPALQRGYRLMALPLGKQGLLLIHSLRLVEPRTEQPQPLVEGRYRAPSGFITQCCHCRRLRRVENHDQWDFVPEAWVADLKSQISHGICHPCLCFHYSI